MALLLSYWPSFRTSQYIRTDRLNRSYHWRSQPDFIRRDFYVKFEWSSFNINLHVHFSPDLGILDLRWSRRARLHDDSSNDTGLKTYIYIQHLRGVISIRDSSR